MKAKEKWIEETLNSLDNTKRVEISFSLAQKILQELRKSETKVVSIRPQIKWAVAASLALLIGLNSLMIIQYNKTIKQHKQESYNLSENYFDYTEQF